MKPTYNHRPILLSQQVTPSLSTQIYFDSNFNIHNVYKHKSISSVAIVILKSTIDKDS